MNTVYLTLALVSLLLCLYALVTVVQSLLDALRRLRNDQPFLQIYVLSPLRKQSKPESTTVQRTRCLR